MSSTQTRITFYVAPSKERHPLVSQLFRFVDVRESETPRMVSGARIEGFLAGTFEISDAYGTNMYEGDFDSENCWSEEEIPHERILYEETKKFFDLYRELCALGYLSEDYEHRSWSSGGWFWDNDHESKEYERQKNKRKLKHFWQEYPNLMSIIKYGRPADGQPQSLL